MLMDIQNNHKLETFKHQLVHEQTKCGSSTQRTAVLSQRSPGAQLECRKSSKTRAKWNDPDTTDEVYDSVYLESPNSQKGRN